MSGSALGCGVSGLVLCGSAEAESPYTSYRQRRRRSRHHQVSHSCCEGLPAHCQVSPRQKPIRLRTRAFSGPMRSAAASCIQPRFQDGAQSDKTPRCSSKTSSRQTLYATGALVLFADLASARAASAPRHPRRGGGREAAAGGGHLEGSAAASVLMGVTLCPDVLGL